LCTNVAFWRGEQFGDATQFVQHRPARRFGGVRGEDGSNVDPICRTGNLGASDFPRIRRRGDLGCDVSQPATFLGSAGGEAAAAVYLFGHVGQHEEDGECPDERDGISGGKALQ
jgi:hypothetical protein